MFETSIDIPEYGHTRNHRCYTSQVKALSSDMHKVQPLTSGHRTALTKWHVLIYFNLKFIFAIVNSVVGPCIVLEKGLEKKMYLMKEPEEIYGWIEAWLWEIERKRLC